MEYIGDPGDIDPIDYYRNIENNDYCEYNFEERERLFDEENFPIRSTLNLRKHHPK